MALDSDIRDQAYQFFTQEALDLIQVLETELLTLFQDRNTAKVHSLMRAAHSIKGGAASVGLEEIKQIAHRLEDCFKALHHDSLILSPELETVFLQAFDCLKQPLLDEIQTGCHDRLQAQQQAESIFTTLEACLEGFIGEGVYLPSAVELGVDLTQSIFEVDIQEGLDKLAALLNQELTPQEVASELCAQAEVFTGIAELLNLSGFGEIAQMAVTATRAYPAQAVEIAQVAIANLQAAQQEVLAGDRSLGGSPSAALRQWLPNQPDPETALPATSLPPAATAWVDDDLESGFETFDAPDFQSFSTASGDLIWGDPALIAETADALHAYPDLIWTDTFADAHTPQVDLLWADTSDVHTPQIDLLWADTSLTENFTANASISEPIGLDTSSTDIANPSDQIATDGSSPEVLPSTDATETNSLDLVSSSVQPQQTVADWVNRIAQDFENLPTIDSTALPPNPLLDTGVSAPQQRPKGGSAGLAVEASRAIAAPGTDPEKAAPEGEANQTTVRVPLDRLEQMNNQVGELVINRNSLSLQNEQLQKTVQELLRRFGRFQSMATQLRDLSDLLLISPEQNFLRQTSAPSNSSVPQSILSAMKLQTEFDSLEMDSYGELHLLIQSILEEVAQLEENTGDIGLLAKQTSQSLNGQRQMLSRVQEDLMWARMLPLGQVLNRFPRVLRDLSLEHHKQVDLKLSGMGVLVDKAALEQLYSPLMHIFRNAFDHGIESPEVRRLAGKPEQGKIEIRAYHRGSQTIIEVQDDGRGVNYERIRERAVALDWVSVEDAPTLTQAQLLELIFQPGFSTALKVTDLSGRGVGLDVVRSQVQALKGTVTISSVPHQGTTFTLRIPLTLTVNKLLVCLVGSSALALPSDSVEEILVPKPEQIKASAQSRLLYWRNQLIPIQSLAGFLDYARPLPTMVTSAALVTTPIPSDWALPLLLLRHGQNFVALEIDRIVTEQELVIKPFGNALMPPKYLYGCTTLGDGSLVPVLDGTRLLEQMTQQMGVPPLASVSSSVSEKTESSDSAITEGQASSPAIKSPSAAIGQANTILIVDDSIALRQTLALTLQKAGYQVVQARDGREALERLQHNRGIQLVICDVEMPVMNGFEFLSHRRQDPTLLEIPVAMLTSRSNDKHRRLALHLGATAYFVKPYIEQEFLAAIAQLKATKQAALVS